ncbi:porin [Bradyrhizobium sp. Tv2a-2]|uniref:porin n=1 Tax=Bradyrhizobium sp. Tv2a-2 TaxID=113395 RepID=UPI000467CCD3|nr:porin [Bradyrhizobium sp. Tv2a-2]
MKLVKSLMLGSAASLFTMAAAQAADLPVKAKAVEYVRICSLYGAGFWYIPGTDTCIKLGGFVRAETILNGGGSHRPAWSGDLAQGNRFADQLTARSRFVFNVDTRTATEYGVVRTFSQAYFDFNNFGTTNPSALGAAPASLGGFNTNLLMGAGGGYAYVDLIFIQFAGFTFGRSVSAFQTPWGGYPANNTAWLIGGQDSITGVNNIQYQAQFGSGVSATIGLEDPTQYDRTPLYNLALGIGASGLGTNAYEGWVWPDLNGNIRVDQAWGLFQLSGSLHHVGGTYNVLGAGGVPVSGATALTDSVLSGHPDSKLGGSVMAAFQIRNLPTGPGDDIKFDTTWAKGQTKQVISTSANSPSFAMLGGVPGQFGPSGSYGFGATSDGVYLPTAFGGDGAIHLTTAYGVRGGYNHNWDPHWSTGVYGGAGWLKYDGTAAAEFCAAFGVTHPGLGATYSCNPNFGAAMIGTVTRWTPVKNLTLSGEIQLFHLHQNFSGFSTFSPGAPQPVQNWTFHDQNALSLDIRVQRNF